MSFVGEFRKDLSGGTLTNSASFHSNSGQVAFSFSRNSNSADLNNFVIISTNPNGGGTVSLKNIKISRHQREGSVSVWYDQSEGNNDYQQIDQTRQPYIVRNGGYDKRGMVFNNNNLMRLATPQGGFGGTPEGIPLGNQCTALFVVSRTLDTVTRNTFAGTTVDFALNSNEQPILRRNSTDSFTASQMTTTKGTEVMYIYLVDNDRVPTIHLNDNSQTRNAPFTEAVGLTKGFDIIGENHHSNRQLDSNNVPIYSLNGTMNEAILFPNDQTINLPALKENLNNQYELYS